MVAEISAHCRSITADSKGENMEENKELVTEEKKDIATGENKEHILEDDKSLLTQMRDMEKQTLKWQRVSAYGSIGIFVVIAVSMIILVPRVFNAISVATATLEHIDTVVTEADKTLDDVNAMVAEMTIASTNINKIVDENGQSITDAVGKMSSIDFEGLNDAINDLKNTVGPMASFFGRFK